MQKSSHFNEVLHVLLQLELTYENQPDPDIAERLVAAYEQVLHQLQPLQDPDFCALLSVRLGDIYRNLPVGDQATNLSQAVFYYREALRLWRPETGLFSYPTIQHELGIVYADLPTGDHDANLIQAISCYQEALRFWMPETEPFEYGTAQNSLGTAYYGLKTGDHDAHLTQAIVCFQEALCFRTAETDPLNYALTQHNLGGVYRDLRTGDRTANLEKAIACFQEALRFRTPETIPLDYASTQDSLGFAYHNLPTDDRTANLEKAISCYQEALRFQTPEVAPLAYAITQNNLGLVYSDLPTGDQAAHLSQAISYYQEALRFLTAETQPTYYAEVYLNLGGVYKDLPVGDRAANLTQAIACYQEALRFLTPELDPFDYGTAQNGLGTVYYLLPTGNRIVNLEKAISCYQEALRFRTAESDPSNYALTQHNLGSAYHDLPIGDRAANLEKAISCYQEALRFRKPEATPFDYALTQNDLGGIYLNLPTGDRAANIAYAITCYQEALRFWTVEMLPFSYAKVQNNLGLAYSLLPTGDGSANLVHAITCYQEALRFYTPVATPFECRTAGQNLADLYFTQGKWEDALQAYSLAMDAGEQLYRAGLSTESKSTEIATNVTLYRTAAFAAVRCRRTTEALLILEQGKTRLLTEALRLRVSHPPDVPDEIWAAFEQAGVVDRATQPMSTDIGAQSEGYGSVQAYEERKQMRDAAHVALESAIERVRDYAPSFLQEVGLQTIQPLPIDEYTALVTFSITEQGSVGFVVLRDAKVQAIDIPGFTETQLRRLFFDWESNIEERATGWLGGYLMYLAGEQTSASLLTWQQTITRVLKEVGQQLLLPLFSTFPPNIKHIVFLPSAELFLLPLHAASLIDNASGYVCDRYQVSYAPSIGILIRTQEKALKGIFPSLYAVINPQADPALPFTSVGGTTIAELFVQCKVDEGRVGTVQQVMTGLQGQSYIHFSCHGRYYWNDPPNSGLDLADGRLTLADLQQGIVDLSSARLVMLSACETGVVDVVRGSAEEYLGIPAGFMLAGVPCVISSLWVVPDISTALLIERFYRNHLKQGMHFAEALGEAQMWVRELEVGDVAQQAERYYRQALPRDKPKLFRFVRYYRHLAQQGPTLRPFAHPYYWAAFTVNGM